MVIFHSYVSLPEDQPPFCSGIPWFSYGFPMYFLWFSHVPMRFPWVFLWISHVFLTHSGYSHVLPEQGLQDDGELGPDLGPWRPCRQPDVGEHHFPARHAAADRGGTDGHIFGPAT